MGKGSFRSVSSHQRQKTPISDSLFNGPGTLWVAHGRDVFCGNQQEFGEVAEWWEEALRFGFLRSLLLEMLSAGRSREDG
jgi:hypothetical protein